MGEIGIADLGDVVSVAEIQDFLTGKAIRCSGEAFCMDTGVTLLTIDKGIYADRNGLTSGVVRFGLREERDFLRVIKSVNRDGFLKNDDILYPDEFAVSCDPELLTDHEIIDIFYCIQGYNQTIDRPILRFAGARVPGTNIGMIVKGIEFIRDELFGVKKRISVDIQLHPQQRADAHVPEGAYKKEKTERKSPDLNVPGYISFKSIMEGYTPRAMREDEKMYKYHTNSIRALLKGDKDKENLYSLGEKLPGKGNNLFFKEGYMLKLHQRFAEKDFEWQDPDSIYAPERYMKKEIVGGDEKKVSPENADKADAQNTKPGRTADKGQDKSAGNGAMPELEQTVAAEAVKKAAAKGFFPVEDAIYFMLPARYDSRQGGCIGAVNGLRARIKEYALNYLKNSGIQCLTDSDDSAVISPGEITGFYNKVIREFQNEMQAFIKKFGFIDDEQPDIRFTPNETLALFKNIYEVYTKEKNQLSRKELCRRLGKTCSNSTLAHKHLDTIWEFVLDMKATTRNMITCKVEENEALTILRNYGIIDPEAFLIEKSDDLMAENNRLFQKPLVEAAMKRRFEMQKPYVFYTLR